MRLCNASFYLVRQLMEKEFGETGDSFVMVHNTGCDLADLTFDLDHVIKDQVCQHLEGVLPHSLRFVSQSEKVYLGITGEFQVTKRINLMTKGSND